MASSSSSSIAAPEKKYDVFLSFRGEDTRNTFISTLHGVLRRENIHVFIDDELNRGEEIPISLMKAIEESMISVIVFSKGYASSRWCLEELVKILECKEMYEQEVIPVFFHTDPSNVRNRTGNFGHGFAELVHRFSDEVRERWRNALRQAANISGWTLDEYTPEYEFAEKIVRDISKKLNCMYPGSNKNLVGINRIIRDIYYPLELQNCLSKGVGIWGMGGIGKTTIASVVFNKIRSRFEDSYFAPNVREESNSPGGLTPLKEKLLSTIFKYQHSTINFNFIKAKLGHKKVLIVFDDVTSFSQIEFLIGDLNYLGRGSRIIITSRDKQVLKSCRIKDDDIYEVKGLFDKDALQLFSWYAFHRNHPNADYYELSNMIVKYAKGVPLAIKVLGSFLVGKPKQVWESEIKKLEIIPHQDIQEVLKISYDGLDSVEKNIFLDIACFLKWEDKDFVIEFLNACEFNAEIGISVLTDKCLIIISDENKITMHDLLQEMGWEIVRRESTEDPGERSRLWHYEDIYNVLEENMGTKAIEGICLDMSKKKETIQLQPCTLAMMRKLRFFKLHNSHCEDNNINKVHVSPYLNYVLGKLRYFCWHGCPLKSLQSNFHPKNLVALDMPYSNIEQLLTGFQLIKLKHIDLSYSKHLIKIQDLSLAPNLERLILKGCTSLLQISSSTQNHNKLILLDLRHCKSLHSLPKGIHLESLRKVFLSCCSNLKTFLEISCNIEELFLDETAIKELSLSIENPSRLVILNLKNCTMLARLFDNLGYLEALKELNLTNCCIKELPNNLGQLSSLESLFLGRNNFESIPTSIKDLSRLSYLDVSYCKRLQFLSKLPSQLKSINAHSCSSLEAVASLPEFLRNSSSVSGIVPRNVIINFSNCFKLDRNALKEIVKDALRKMEPSRAFAQRKIKNFLRPTASICFPGIDIPEWFSFQSQGSSVTLELQSVLSEDAFVSFDLCVIVEFRNYQDEGQGLVVGFDCMFNDVVYHQGALSDWDYGTGPHYIYSDHIFLGYDSLPEFFSFPKSHKMTFQFYVKNVDTNPMDYCNVKKCGVNLFSKTVAELGRKKVRKTNNTPRDRNFRRKANPAQANRTEPSILTEAEVEHVKVLRDQSPEYWSLKRLQSDFNLRDLRLHSSSPPLPDLEMVVPRIRDVFPAGEGSEMGPPSKKAKATNEKDPKFNTEDAPTPPRQDKGGPSFQADLGVGLSTYVPPPETFGVKEFELDPKIMSAKLLSDMQGLGTKLLPDNGKLKVLGTPLHEVVKVAINAMLHAAPMLITSAQQLSVALEDLDKVNTFIKDMSTLTISREAEIARKDEELAQLRGAASKVNEELVRLRFATEVDAKRLAKAEKEITNLKEQLEEEREAQLHDADMADRRYRRTQEYRCAFDMQYMGEINDYETTVSVVPYIREDETYSTMINTRESQWRKRARQGASTSRVESTEEVNQDTPIPPDGDARTID